MFVCFLLLTLTVNSHTHMTDDRQKRAEFCSRLVPEPSVFLDSFSYPDNSQTSDTVSVDSSDSLETSFSACSPDNISRSVMNHQNVQSSPEFELLNHSVPNIGCADPWWYTEDTHIYNSLSLPPAPAPTTWPRSRRWSVCSEKLRPRS